MCNCIDRINEQMLEMMKKEMDRDNMEITEDPKLECTALMLSHDNNNSWIATYSEVIGRYDYGRSKRKFQRNIHHTFCPFCGERYEKTF